MSELLEKIKGTFIRLSLREKLITLVFVFIILGLWGNHIIGRISSWNSHLSTANTELKFQQSVLDEADFFAAGVERALERLDPSKTYSATQLSGRIDTLLRQTALAGKSDIDPVKSKEGEIFNDHNIRVRLNRITITQLIKFHDLISAETPYINLQSVRLNANRNNPEELDVRFEINSFELIDQNPGS